MTTKPTMGVNPDQLAKAVQAFGMACKKSIEFNKERWVAQIKNLSIGLGIVNNDSLNQCVQRFKEANKEEYIFKQADQEFHTQVKMLVHPDILPETMEIIKGLSPLLWESFTLFLKNGYSPHTAFKVCNSIGQLAKQHPAVASRACSRQEMIDMFTELCLKTQ